LQIITLNANGIRSAHRKGFFEWMKRRRPDVVCIQELKAQLSDIPPEIAQPRGYHTSFHPAEKKGYSGVAIYSRRRPDHVQIGLGWDDFDREGRFIQADFGKLSVISVYLPSGSSSELRQAAKFDFMERFLPVLKSMRRKRRDFVICGDWNIAHKKIDIENWRSNQKNSGFLPEERQWMTELFDTVGFVDAFRVVNQDAKHYTWWSNRGRAWEKNVGWRIDYQIITPRLSASVRKAAIYKARRFSDHAPLIIDYELE